MFASLALTSLLATGALAHFRLEAPPPRGPFVADREPEFCGGYTDVTTNRTVFPLNDGYFRIRQGHEDWSVAVTVSTAENPNNFESFGADPNVQYVRYFAKEAKAGNFCIPIDIGASGVEGIEEGANVTIQIVVDGGDGTLYQCADLTLSANATLDQGACTNSTSEGHHGGASGSHSADAPGASGEPGDEGSAFRLVASAAALGLAGVVAAVTNAF